MCHKLSIHVPMDTRAVCTFQLLWITLVWICVCKHLWIHLWVHPLLMGVHTGMELLLVHHMGVLFNSSCPFKMGFPRFSGKESACKCKWYSDTGLIPGSGRSPRGGNGNSLQHSCLENSMDRGAWRTTVHGAEKRVGHDWACTPF